MTSEESARNVGHGLVKVLIVFGVLGAIGVGSVGFVVVRRAHFRRAGFERLDAIDERMRLVSDEEALAGLVQERRALVAELVSVGGLVKLSIVVGFDSGNFPVGVERITLLSGLAEDLGSRDHYRAVAVELGDAGGRMEIEVTLHVERGVEVDEDAVREIVMRHVISEDVQSPVETEVTRQGDM